MNIFSNESQSETIEKTARKKVLQTPLSNNKTHSRVSLCLSFFVGHFTPILPQANLEHKKTNPNRLVFLGKFGRHDRI
ncbi:hypothetical protein [Xenorhabdus sp. TH1]|uniref:hypothetical protein n=1 Tax=Xenorhabdus sp. TH1 TaxID=3130166 RepID=UPI0030D27E4C